ncbi:MAG: hypothetical protein QM613_05280 [Micrococcaceae bacterium]
MITHRLPFKQMLLAYACVLTVLCIFAQIVVAVKGDDVGAMSALALLPAFFYYLYFNSRASSKLNRVRFGKLITHFITFLIVNLSYHIHAAIVVNHANNTMTLPSGWYGVLFGMFVIWGIALAIHTVISIANSGFEELDVRS